jgi:isoquinoline 1-oxidoreductase beta subunit
MRRRTVVIGGLLGAGTLIVGWWFAHTRDRLGNRQILPLARGEAALNGWIKIAPSGRITVAVPRAEMGQGIHTTLAQLAAEELDARWQDVTVVDPPEHEIYRNVEILVDGLPFSPEETGRDVAAARWTATRVAGILGYNATGGSTSTRDAYRPLRIAGASARAVLIAAASRRAGVPETELVTADSEVRLQDGSLVARYGDLVGGLAGITPPFRVPLKRPTEFRLIGQPVPRLDIADKVRGAAVFGIDVRPPGMLYAALRHCPVLGGTLRSVESPADGLPAGILGVVPLGNAIAVVASSWWQANELLSRTDAAGLKVEWEPGAAGKLDSESLRTRFEALTREGEPALTRNRRRPAAPQEQRPELRRIEAVYEAPYLAHATMEPMNCTARFDGRGNLEVWMPSQSASLVRRAAARAGEIDATRVTVHTTYLGGGFGRRAEMDLVREAVSVARTLPGSAVQVLWSREEDMRHDYYRPMAICRLVAGIEAGGTIAEWRVRLVGQSASSQFAKRNLQLPESGRPDNNSVENPAYAFADYTLEAVVPDLPVPVGFWRSVGHSHTAFFEECFLDEIAHLVGKDPLALRRELLQQNPRHLAVLDRAAREAGWGEALPAGRARGLALRASFESIVAQVAEVSIEGGSIRVHRVTCAVDCGPVVNPAIVSAQMRSGIIFGLTAALYGEITLRGGMVEQANFPDYDMIRLADAPRMDVHIVDTGASRIGGVGEPGTPPIAPAVGNALFALTGQRLRSLPFRLP